MKNYVVMTSINAPTEAVRKYAEMKDWKTIMVGDKKTPAGWNYKNVTYISPEDQLKLPYSIVEKLPWNLPARANLAYLEAMREGAEFITQSDDDNIPNKRWSAFPFTGKFKTLKQDGFVNIYKHFTEKFVWPRGYPLNMILTDNKPKEIDAEHKIGAWQHLADKDTDVDAIYRLVNNDFVYFKDRKPLVLSPGTICPFNCQSTTFHKDTYVLMYLPSYITPRASDILRGLVAQPIMAHYGYSLGFTPSTVTQERNPHNYLRDFKEEILIYLHSEEIVNITKKALQEKVSMSENMLLAYEALVQAKLVPPEEIPLLKAWIKDVESVTTGKKKKK